jgi:hypothetical protein
MSDRLTVPAWAAKIDVKRFRGKLLVQGSGRVPNLTVFASSSQADSSGPLSQYVPTISIGEKRWGLPPHLKFATAMTQRAQIAFVAKYGPIWGVVKRSEPAVLVEQDLDVLRDEQERFFKATTLAEELRNTGELDMERISLLFLELAIGCRVGLPVAGHLKMFSALEEKWGLPDLVLLEDPASLKRDPRMETWYEYCAHWTLCRLLNRFQPELTFFDGRPAELPRHAPEGILPVLYFMLRSDYLSTERRIATCENTSCKQLFAIERSGQRFCSSKCSTLQRGRDYWHRKGKERRRARRGRQT